VRSGVFMIFLTFKNILKDFKTFQKILWTKLQKSWKHFVFNKLWTNIANILKEPKPTISKSLCKKELRLLYCGTCWKGTKHLFYCWLITTQGQLRDNLFKLVQLKFIKLCVYWQLEKVDNRISTRKKTLWKNKGKLGI